MSQHQQFNQITPLIHWTAEQIVSLAPDQRSTRLAEPAKWLILGSAPEMIWGELPVRNKPAIQTAIRPAEPVFACSCDSKSAPCDHAISLLLMAAETPASFQPIDPPDWVRARLNAIPPFDLADRAPSPESGERQAALMEGLAELELWLHDLARNGLAEAAEKPKKAWTQVAERLIDAGASEVAREVRRIAEIPASGAGWPERLLGRIGMLYLLIQGFKHLESLPPEMQSDLRMAAGWLPRLDAANPDQCVRDRWQVVSNQLLQEGRQRVQRTWLWGEHHHRAALIVQRSYKRSAFDTRLMIGTLLDADLYYFASAMPIRAQLGQLYERDQPAAPPAGYTSIEQGITAYSHAISRNPWIGAFPLMLSGATTASDRGGWLLVDHSGALPLPPDYAPLWQLRALIRHADCPIFAEWDGEALRPLSVWAGQRWIELRGKQGGK